ncbi:Bifunctional NAD(P)H-hydrate repair enzyme Nnr [bacterium HR36]|nr:Bifunctional NAD(P)H-hydrate repair enzyme Nnr [bacterium HR36]
MEIVTSLPLLPPRPADSHKGTFGRVLIVAGSRGMSGAAVLCGLGALRGGAGLVQVATPADIQPVVAAANPCYLTAALPQDEQGRLCYQAWETILELARVATVVAAGPGWGQSVGLQHLAARLVRELPRPLVLDADALNNLAQAGLAWLENAPAVRILTPHPGEFARLLGLSTAQVQTQREELAAAFARQHRLIVVLKGHGTVVSDGERLYRNHTGNPGMATGGTGDVLTGLLAALLAQRLEPFTAAQLAVFLHGRAGDLARDAKGEIGLTASDVADFLPWAIRQCIARLIPTAERDTRDAGN